MDHIRTVEVSLPEKLPTSTQAGIGLTKHPVSGIAIPEQLPGKPGSPTTFHSACDAPAGTTVSYGGGPFLNQPTLLCAFWGAIWNTPLSPGVGDIFAAVASLSSSVTNEYGSFSYFDGLGTGYSFDPGQPPIVVTSSTVTIPQAFAQSDIENATRAIINTLGPHISWDLLVIFMPPGFALAGGQVSGAHTYYHDPGDASVVYAWIDYSTQLGNITYTLSHEMVEAMTDPFGTTVQVNPRNSGAGGSWNEICDVCCSSAVYNGVTVASYFSQSAGACMIPSPPVASLPPNDYQIDMVRKVWDTRPGQRVEFILSVSGPGNGNGRWVMAEADVVNLISAGQATFYTMVDGVRANVIVERWYLKTVADGFTPNNLDSLPEF